MGARRLVCPAADILWWHSVSNNSTHCGGLSGITCPLVLTRVFLSFSFWELWMFSLKSSNVFMSAGKILNFASNGWIAELLWSYSEFKGGTVPRVETNSSASSLATFRAILSFNNRPSMHIASLSSSMSRSTSLMFFFFPDLLRICWDPR